jgi:hypothetical protein
VIAAIACLRFSQRYDVGAILHGYAEAERRLAALAHQEGRRVLVTAPHRRNVAEPKDLAIGLHRHRGNRRDAGERAGHPHVDAVRRGVDRAAGDHRILPGRTVEDLLRSDAQRGELGVAELDEDLLRPLADDVDLVDVGNSQQALADVFGAGL